jgi:hypothetical protein
MGTMGQHGMMEEHGMMGQRAVMGKQEMMRMMASCPCGFMGMRMMMGGGQNPAMTAKMMRMQAEMMKADAAILERYAKEISEGK